MTEGLSDGDDVIDGRKLTGLPLEVSRPLSGWFCLHRQNSNVIEYITKN